MSNLLMACNGGEEQEVDLTDGLVAHYLLNNNIHENVNNTIGNTANTTFDGDMASFNGNGYIETSEQYDGTGNTFTWSAWFISNNDSDNRILGIYDDSVSNRQYLINVNSSNIIEIGGYESGHSNVTTSFNTGQLYHAVLVKTATHIEGFVNGSSIGSVAFDSDTNNEPLVIGNSKPITNGVNNFSGMISNVRIYSDVKNQSFVDALYEEGYYPKPLPLPTTDGLVAHYPLTGTAEDVTGNYDGTENGNTYVDDAEFGSVASFDAPTEAIFPSISGMTGTDITLSCWVKGEFTGSDYGLYFLGQKCSTNDLGRGVYISYTGVYSVYLRDSSSAFKYNTSPTAPTATKHDHVLVTFSGRNYSLYVNGVLSESNQFASATTLWTDTFNIASPTDASGSYLIGNMRDVRFYNRALTAQEATDIYNYEKNFRHVDIDDGLVAYYPLANNSLDNYYNEYDGIDTNVTYDGNSVKFDGVSGYTRLGYEQWLGSTTLSLGFASWIKMPQDGLALLTAARESVAIGDSNIMIEQGESRVQLYVNCMSQSPYVVQYFIPYTFNADTWYHVYVEKIGNTSFALYVNGEFVDRVTTGYTYSNTPSEFSKLEIGRKWHHTYSTTYYESDMARFRLYNKTLTHEQVEVIYNTEKGDFGL